MIPKEVISMALEFLKRTELKGTEVDAFLTVVRTLQAEVQETPQEVSNEASEA